MVHCAYWTPQGLVMPWGLGWEALSSISQLASPGPTTPWVTSMEDAHPSSMNDFLRTSQALGSQQQMCHPFPWMVSTVPYMPCLQAGDTVHSLSTLASLEPGNS